jgi:hypothetical protein
MFSFAVFPSAMFPSAVSEEFNLVTVLPVDVEEPVWAGAVDAEIFGQLLLKLWFDEYAVYRRGSINGSELLYLMLKGIEM